MKREPLKEQFEKVQAKEMCSRITFSCSYNEALNIIEEYVEVTSVDEEETEDFEMEMK
ncbi:MAG: hypothetical protein LUG91_03860 [Ruminococcus sp.]|nr:hypothetical protein [Ruminococcus sp.]